MEYLFIGILIVIGFIGWRFLSYYMFCKGYEKVGIKVVNINSKNINIFLIDNPNKKGYVVKKPFLGIRNFCVKHCLIISTETFHYYTDGNWAAVKKEGDYTSFHSKKDAVNEIAMWLINESNK